MTTSAVFSYLSRPRTLLHDWRSLAFPASALLVSCLKDANPSQRHPYLFPGRHHRQSHHLSAVDGGTLGGAVDGGTLGDAGSDVDHRSPEVDGDPMLFRFEQRKKPLRSFKSVYGMAKAPETTPWAEGLKVEEEQREKAAAAMPIPRSFKSIYEVADKDPDSAPWADKFQAVQKDFFDMYPDEKINHLKHLQLQRTRHRELVIMNVTVRDVFLYMQPSRTIICALAPFPFYYMAKWAVMSLHVPSLPATLISISLTFLVFYKYLSSICTQIRQDPKTSTYSAFFPFRFLSQEVRFRRNHFQLISTKRDPFRTCHVLIKGRKAFCPKRCFISHTHYDELICSTVKLRAKNVLR